MKNKKWLITLIAVVGYGGWAYLSSLLGESSTNMNVIAIRAGIIQGLYSGGLTLISVVILEWIFLKLNPLFSCTLNILVTLCSVTLIQYGFIIPIHLLNGTPNIFITLLPGFLIGTTFSFIYLMALKKHHFPTAR